MGDQDSPRRRRLALRCAAVRLRGGRLGGLVLITMPQCGVVAVAVAAAVATAVAAIVAAVNGDSGGYGDGGGAASGFFPGGGA